MEAAGIEPASRRKPGGAEVGQNVSKDGHDGSQVGQLEGVAVCPTCKGRTGAGQSRPQAGRETSTTGAQRKEAVGALEADVGAVLDGWAQMPKAARRAIVLLLRALQAL